MKIKDSTIILLLILTWFFLACGVLGAENEINRMEDQIAQVCGTQDYLLSNTKQIAEKNAEQDQRLSDIERKDRVQDYRLALHRQELTDSAEMFTDLLESTERLEEYMKSLPDNALGLDLTAEDEYMIASLVYLEAGSGSYELQKAIASVIFNRMIRYGMTARQVIYQPGVFSPASRVASTRPSGASQMAVREVLENGSVFPVRVCAFQLGGYHSFGTPFCKIQSVYFTLV